MRRFLTNLLRVLQNEFGARECVLVLGLGLTSYGAGLIFLPAAFIVPGLACTALAWPSSPASARPAVRRPTAA